MVKVVELSGGVGGARLARGLDRVADVELTVIVNVADDDVIHGLYVSPDLDTVLYTLAGVEGPGGWGRKGDSFATSEELGNLGADNRFQLGDRDLALNILRTEALSSGETLTDFTARTAGHLGITSAIIPATDSPVRTIIENREGELLSFQQYFVVRQHRDVVAWVEYEGAESAVPAPGVIDAIEAAELVVVGPSNPPLSIWPILAVPGIRDALTSHPNVVAVSPLFGGKALKGPADRVMASLGLPPGNVGVARAYSGVIRKLVIDHDDRSDLNSIDGIEVVVADTRIGDAAAARIFAEGVLLK